MSVDEGKAQAQTAQGHAADQELRTLGKAFEDSRKAIMTGWAATKSEDTEARENFWLAHKMTTQIEEMLRQYVATGKVAERQLEIIRNAGRDPKAKPRVA